ncbi:Rare lipoprotein B [Thiorhodococcus drewsii AZ1]|uniref:LPS-assembly lipoprotein LptE n=1 Tax=Thiorhodococcus drewsii AZ1 TaxID=765913 RepID=G2DYG7_9GAMM|nr:LPS assembly lipoprotein LptE [Thiorhodococcus drewsii]EGV32594.1 Rare lipoprotein B [Thiorhodococcus drewsii AZ1]
MFSRRFETARSGRPVSARVGTWLLVSLLVAVLVSGCGFQLRGEVEIPQDLTPIYVDSSPGSPVRSAIRDLLTGSQVHLTENPAEANLRLRILSEGRSSRVAAVNANGKTLAYELHYVVRFDAVSPDGAQKVPTQTMDLVRNFDNPDVEVLGKQLEEDLIYEDFATDAADRILMRLRAVLN